MSTKSIAAIGLLTMSLTAAAQSLAEPSNELEAAASAIVEKPASVSDDVQRSLDEVMRHFESPAWRKAQDEWRRDIQRLSVKQVVAKS